MKTKRNLHSFSPFVFTWHGAKKGSDRFYAWLDDLSHLKRVYVDFSTCIYIADIVTSERKEAVK